MYLVLGEGEIRHGKVTKAEYQYQFVTPQSNTSGILEPQSAATYVQRGYLKDLALTSAALPMSPDTLMVIRCTR